MKTKVDFDRLYREVLRLHGFESYRCDVTTACVIQWARLKPEDLPLMMADPDYLKQSATGVHVHVLLCHAAKQYLETETV